MLLRDLCVQFGGEVVSALQSARILVRGRISHIVLPCGYSKHLPCERRIRYSQNGIPMGVCEHPGNLCANQAINPEQLNSWCLSLDHFATALHLLLQLQGTVRAEPWWGQSTGYYFLGYRTQAAHQEDFFVVFQPNIDSFKALMAMLSNKSSDVWVLIPTWHEIPEDIRLTYGIEMRATLLAMTDIIGVALNSFKLLSPVRKALSRPFKDDAPASKTICVKYSHDNPTVPMPLSEAEYVQLLQDVGQFHIVISTVITTGHDGYVAWVSHDSLPRKVRLPHTEALALREIILAGRPLTSREVKSASNCTRPDKVIERARQKIDKKQKDRPMESVWRAIQTIPAESFRDKAFVFAPVAGLRWCLICSA